MPCCTQDPSEKTNPLLSNSVFYSKWCIDQGPYQDKYHSEYFKTGKIIPAIGDKDDGRDWEAKQGTRRQPKDQQRG